MRQARVLGLITTMVAAAVAGAASPATATSEPFVMENVYEGQTAARVSVDCPERDHQTVRSDMFTAPVKLTPYPGSTVGHGTARLRGGLKEGSSHTVSWGCGSSTTTVKVSVRKPQGYPGAELTVAPAAARSGDTVRLLRYCYKASLPITDPESPVLTEVVKKEQGPYQSVFTATVRAGAKPGRHPVRVVCGPETRVAWLTVAGAPPPPHLPGPRPGQVPVKPRGGVETGGGELP